MCLGWGLDPQGQEGLLWELKAGPHPPWASPWCFGGLKKPCHPVLLQASVSPSRPPRAVSRLTGPPHCTVGSAASRTAQVMVNKAKVTCHQARQASGGWLRAAHSSCREGLEGDGTNSSSLICSPGAWR